MTAAPAPPPPAGRDPLVVFGLEGLQPDGAVSDAAVEAALGYVRAFAACEPGSLAGVSVDASLDAGRLTGRLPGEIAVVAEPGVQAGDRPVVFHVLSLQAGATARRLWPLWARRPSVALAVSVYDDVTRLALETPGSDRAGRLRSSRHRLIGAADVVVATSHAAALDVVGWAGVDPDKVFVARQPATPPARHVPGAATGHLAGSHPGLQPDGSNPDGGFVVAAASASSSMHNEVLVEAFASLEPSLRLAWRLVLASRSDHGSGMDRLRTLIDSLGVAGQVTVATGLGDDEIGRLYGSCRVAFIGGVEDGSIGAALEAASGGAGIVVADHDALVDLVAQPDARFYPMSVESTRSMLRRCLTDAEFCVARRDETAEGLAGYSQRDTARALKRAYRRAAEARPRRTLPAAAASL